MKRYGHGQYKIEDSEDILFTKWMGSWNEEMMEEFHWKIRSVYESRTGNPFIEILDISEWELTSLDVIETTVDHNWNDYKLSVGLKLYIIIIKSNLIESLTYLKYKSRVHIPVEIVHSYNDALHLVRSRENLINHTLDRVGKFYFILEPNLTHVIFSGIWEENDFIAYKEALDELFKIIDSCNYLFLQDLRLWDSISLQAPLSLLSDILNKGKSEKKLKQNFIICRDDEQVKKIETYLSQTSNKFTISCSIDHLLATMV
ncbi:MAG: hypothetical protein OCD02_16340 [Spirochaetaceae bacterium]